MYGLCPNPQGWSALETNLCSAWLELVSLLYLSNCILDYFNFVKVIQELGADSASGFMVFDIVSLFTNVALVEND